MIRILATIAALLAMPAVAATLPATPATCSTLAAVLSPTLPGGTVVALAPGDCTAVIAIKGRTYSPPITIDASAATLTSLVFNDVHGINVVGGKALGGRNVNAGITFTASSNFSIDGYSCDSMKICAVIDHSSDFVISEMTVTNPLSDGVDIAFSQRGLIQRLKCMGFNPSPGAHPDCGQIFDLAGEPHVTDITVSDSVAVGNMQGFNIFDHLRAPPYERIKFIGNRIMTMMPDGISLPTPPRCIGCVMLNNVADALPGSVYYIQVHPDGVDGNRGGPVRPQRLPKGASAAATVAAASVASPQ